MKFATLQNRRLFSTVLVCAVVVFSTSATEDRLTFAVWPGAVPADSGKSEWGPIGAERVRDPNDSPSKDAKWITAVTKPTITVFPASKEKNTGAAMVICPGGGYWNLAWDLEGEEVAAALNKAGITGFILKYRVPRRQGEPERLPAPGPLLDAQRAISSVRSRAAEFGVAADRIGIVGFSAGGHLAVAAATRFDERGYAPIDDIDKASCRPDFAVAIYPGYFIEQPQAGTEVNKDALASYMRIPKGTPPIFLAHAHDDVVAGPENSVLLYLALKKANIPAELHIYAKGGHGFGVRSNTLPGSNWLDRMVDWLESQDLVKKPSPAK